MKYGLKLMKIKKDEGGALAEEAKKYDCGPLDALLLVYRIVKKLKNLSGYSFF